MIKRILCAGVVLVFLCQTVSAHDYIEKKPSAYTYKDIYDDVYVPYTGADKTTNLGSQHLTANSTEINTSRVNTYQDLMADSEPTTPAANIVRLYSYLTQGHSRPAYKDDDNIVITIGEDNFVMVRNTSGGALTKGQVVYQSGSTGNVPNIALAKSDSINTLPAIGLLLQDLSNNAYGYCLVLGIISNIDTSAFTSGDRLYVSSVTAGALQNTRPVYPNYAQRIGSVSVSGVGNGSVRVAIAPFVGGEESGTDSSSGFTASIGKLYGSPVHSGVSAGTSPFQTVSTTVTTNLNADLLDGLNAVDFKDHQHNSSYPSTSQFQQLYSIATTNQHDTNYADIDHQHSSYQTAGSFADATHSHSNYTPLSDFTTHQHSDNYATVAQNQAVAAIATTNTHAVATAAAPGFVLALPSDATRYWDGSGAYSVPAGGGATGHLHPFYTPLSVYGTHAHANYVPYTGATSTVNLGSQHLVAAAAEIDGNFYAAGNTGIGVASPTYKLQVNGTTAVFNVNANTATANSPIAYFTDAAAGYSDFEIYSDATNVMIGPWADKGLQFVGNAGTETKMTIMNNGNVGINATTPSDKLEVSGNISITNQGYLALIARTGTNGGTLFVNNGTGTNLALAETASNVYTFGVANIGSAPTNTVIAMNSSTERVGIGTRTPGYKLEVNGDLFCENLVSNHQHSEYSTSGGGVDSFETLASPQALQGIEQLRHNVASYQNYGNVIVDGLQDLTGIAGVHQLTYAGTPDYQYTISTSATGTLLSHWNSTDGATSYTAETGQVATFGNNAQIDTAQKKFGASSLLFDGTTDYLTFPESSNWAFGSGDFTINSQVRFNALPSAGNEATIIGQWISAGNQRSFYYYVFNSAGTYSIRFTYSTTGLGATGTLSVTWPGAATGQWFHFEVVRSGANVYFFVDGTQVGATQNIGADSLFDSTGALELGAYNLGAASTEFNGWEDETYINKGTAEHTANFSAPTAEYSSSQANGFIHSLSYPMPTVPTHLGVSVKIDSAFPDNSQHTYLKVDISRDGGTTFTDCHPITKIGTSGYYRADQETITSQPSGSNALAKITLSGSTARALKGYSIYGE